MPIEKVSSGRESLLTAVNNLKQHGEKLPGVIRMRHQTWTPDMLRKLRTEILPSEDGRDKGWTQEKIANWLGISVQTWSAWERGESNNTPGHAIVDRLLWAYEQSLLDWSAQPFLDTEGRPVIIRTRVDEQGNRIYQIGRMPGDSAVMRIAEELVVPPGQEGVLTLEPEGELIA